jgi:serine/threonine protein kinase
LKQSGKKKDESLNAKTNELLNQIYCLKTLYKKGITGFLQPTEFDFSIIRDENGKKIKKFESRYPVGYPLHKHPNKVNVSIFLEQSLRYLDEFHTIGHCHGDIKPSNMVKMVKFDKENKEKYEFIDFGSANRKPVRENDAYSDYVLDVDDAEFKPFTTNSFYPRLHQSFGYLSTKDLFLSDKYALGLSALWILHRQQNPNKDSYQFINEFSQLPTVIQEKQIDVLTSSDDLLKRRLKHLILDPHLRDSSTTVDEARFSQETTFEANLRESSTTVDEARFSNDTTTIVAKMASHVKTTTPFKKEPKRAPFGLAKIIPRNLFGNNLKQVPGMIKIMAGPKKALMQPCQYIGMPVKILPGLHHRPPIFQDFFRPLGFHHRPPIIPYGVISSNFHRIPANPHLICLTRAPEIPKSGIKGVIKKSEKPMIIRNLFKVFRFLRQVI